MTTIREIWGDVIVDRMLLTRLGEIDDEEALAMTDITVPGSLVDSLTLILRRMAEEDGESRLNPE